MEKLKHHIREFLTIIAEKIHEKAQVQITDQKNQNRGYTTQGLNRR
jgi:hypothetical protein